MNTPFKLGNKQTVQDIVQSVQRRYAQPQPQHATQQVQPPVPSTQQTYPGQSPTQPDNVLQFNPRAALVANRAGKGGATW